MKRKPVDVVRELCQLTGASSLQSYLELMDGAGPDEARQKLRARRRRLQGMQGNPKFKTEAVFVIRNYGVLEQAIDEPGGLGPPPPSPPQLISEPEHESPTVLEATLRSLLSAGPLTAAQEETLRQNAVALGLSGSAFDELLSRVTDETGWSTPAPPPLSVRYPLSSRGSLNHYQALGVGQSARPDEIRRAYFERATEAGQAADPLEGEAFLARIDRAWDVLSDPSRRAAYDLTVENTGPPAKNRVGSASSGAATAPPIQERAAGTEHAARPSRFELSGDDSYELHPGDKVNIALRNRGQGRLEIRTRATAAWLQVEPERLSLLGGQRQILTVTASPTAPPRARAELVLQSDLQTVRVAFVCQPRRSDVWKLAAAVIAGVVPVLVFAAAGLTLEAQNKTMVSEDLTPGMLVVPELPDPDGARPVPSSVAPPPGSLRIRVKPRAESVLVNGVPVGKGTEVIVPRPPRGTAVVVARHRNFRSQTRTIEIGSVGANLELELPLERPLTLLPSRDQRRGSASSASLAEAINRQADAIDTCIRQGSPAQTFLTGTVEVHVNAGGRPVGMSMTGDRADEKTIYTCVEQQAATLFLDELGDGDYATVRYDYTISSGEPSQ